ncbi:hypothetical protein GJ496_004491 [Pomphorhynchus laevis]|nr:hypothetical protein GJ496_004491 [Pomphorhynchus laevis]
MAVNIAYMKSIRGVIHLLNIVLGFAYLLCFAVILHYSSNRISLITILLSYGTVISMTICDVYLFICCLMCYPVHDEDEFINVATGCRLFWLILIHVCLALHIYWCAHKCSNVHYAKICVLACLLICGYCDTVRACCFTDPKSGTSRERMTSTFSPSTNQTSS